MLDKIITDFQYKSFLISYSGGLDSTVLLYQLLKMKKKEPSIKIRAIHINHNLTAISKKWEKHCVKICKISNIPLIIENVYIHKEKNNLEEKLRIKRYSLIFQHLLFDEILLTGHHMNDQCETFFLSLKRGSGPTGLSSMSIKTSFGNKIIVRPFLKKTKKEIEDWANHKKLKWIEDYSNFNTDYDRNFIRHKIIPTLEKKWPFFLKNCFRTIDICKKETILLNHLIHEKIHNFIQFDDSLNIHNFKNIKKEMCLAFIRYWLSLKKIKMPSYKKIEFIYHQMIFSRIDKNPQIILKKNEIRRYKKSLYLIKTQPNLKNTIIFWHKREMKLILPNNLGNLTQDNKGVDLPLPQEDELINIRFQHEGNTLILGRNKKRKIKKIWQEKKIPPWLRNQIPMIFYNNTFISALGVFVVNIKNKNQETWKISWKNDSIGNKENTFLLY